MAAVFDDMIRQSQALQKTAASKTTVDASIEARRNAKLLELQERQAAMERELAARSEAKQKARAIEAHNSARSSSAGPSSRAGSSASAKPQLSVREQKQRRAVASWFEDDDDDRPSSSRDRIHALKSTKARSASPVSSHNRASSSKKGSRQEPIEFIQLNKQKRDLRTIEEIERDMRLRKMEAAGKSPKTADDFFASRSVKPVAQSSMPVSSDLNARPSSSKRKQEADVHPSKRVKMDTNARPDAKTSSINKARSEPPRNSGTPHSSKKVHKTQTLPARSRGKDHDKWLESLGTRTYYEYESSEGEYSDLSDMEAGASEVLAEEERGERLGRLEDLREQKAEQRRIALKAARKAAKTS